MSTKFDNVIEQLSSKLTTEEIEALRESSDLKKERDAAKAAADQVAAENAKLRADALKRNWESIGATGDPARLNLDGIDVTDVEVLRSFATDGGFVVTKPDAPPEELAAHQRIVSASVGAGTGGKPVDELRQALRTQPMTEQEFWATAERARVVNNTDSVSVESLWTR